MDLGLAGKTAFICASSQGLGLACATALAAEGVRVVLNGRDAAKLDRAAEALRATGARVETLVADLTTEAGLAAILAAWPEVDILVTNNAGPPPGALEDWDTAALLGAMQANMIPAVQLMRAHIPGMRARRFGRVVHITSAMVKSPHYMMGLSTSARAGLTAISKAISREVVADNVTINQLLPERIDTPRQEFMAERRMKQEGITREEARARAVSTIAARRFGRPATSGFISGQNLQLDGGSYEGLI